MLTSMAETLYLRNRHENALKYIKRALVINPSTVNAQILYLKVLVGLRLDEEAIKYCENILKTDPNNAGIITEYGRILALRGKEKEALLQFDQALKLDPGNEVALIFLGILAQNKGDVNSALMYFRQSIKANPLNVNTILKLGNYLLDLKQWNEALKLFENALVSSPNNLDLIERCAWIQSTCPDPGIRNGKAALALARRSSMVRKTTHEQDIQCSMTLAAAYAENGDFGSATTLMKNILIRAKEQRLERFIPGIQTMIRLFETKKPYRL